MYLELFLERMKRMKAYQEYLKEKTFRTVVIYFAIKNMFLSNMRSLYTLLCVAMQSLISDAWVHAYINVQHICTLIRRAG